MADMPHLNSHALCVIDVETTGLNPDEHDIIEICAVELDADIKPTGTPLQIYICPDRPENAQRQALKVNRITLPEAINRGMDSMKAIDRFCEWFDSLNLAKGKKIAPLGHNYGFDKSFITKWLGDDLYNLMFDYHVRDSVIAAHYLNDRAYFRNEKQPFSKQSLAYCCRELNVENQSAHTAIGDCLATAEVYRKMLRLGSLLG